MKCGFSIDFSMVRIIPNRVLTPDYKWMHMVLCGAYGPMLFCSSLYKQDQSVDKPKHKLRFDVLYMVRCCSSLYKQDQSDNKWMHMVRCCSSLYKQDQSDNKWMHMVRGDPKHKLRFDALYMVRCCSSLYKQDQSDNKWMHMVRCDPVHMVRCDPCGKQHFREIATPDWVCHFTNLTY